MPGITYAAVPKVSALAASSGLAWTWGDNRLSQLGNGTAPNSASPVAVSMPSGVSFSAIAAGNFHSLALDSLGHAWAWGYNAAGELGNGTTADSSSAVAVSMPSGVSFTAVGAGGETSLALDSNGQAWAWGYDGFGQLGNGLVGAFTSYIPVAVSMPSGVSFRAITSGVGATDALALDTSGQAWAWGYGPFGQLGNGTTGISYSPVPVTMPSGVNFTAIAAGGESNFALDSSGQAWAWGDNTSGKLGNGTTTNSSIPVAVSMPSGVSFTTIAAGEFHAMALDSTGHAWTWGGNAYGALGNGTTADSSSPVAVSMPSAVTFSAIAGGYFDSVALDKSGHAWAWGYNAYGELGNGSTSNSSSPVAVSMPSAVSFGAIAAGSSHVVALFGVPTPPPVVTAITPASGPMSGGTQVTISGSGFTGATAVSFGANPATSFAVDSDAQVTATSPAGTGVVDVRITTSAGTSATSPADRYAYSAKQVPTVPLNVKVVPGNGSALVSWSAPAVSGSSSITGYQVTATPESIPYQLIPSNGGSATSVTVDASKSSWVVTGLTADCHQTYVFSVAATNADGTGPAANAPGPSILNAGWLTSGIVSHSRPPKLVVVLVDGIRSEEPDSFTMTPLSPNAIASLSTSYCPETPYNFGGDQPGAKMPFTSEGMNRFLSKWNFEQSTPLTRPGDNSGYPAYTPTNRFMLDSLAATGAVFLPFSYRGATLALVNGQPQFTYTGYGTGDSCCSPITKWRDLLAAEVQSINKVWPSNNTKIVILSHSLGGLIAEQYWDYAKKHRISNGVTHVISLDGAINGVLVACLGVPAIPLVIGGATLANFCEFWSRNYPADLQNEGFYDRVLVALDSDKSFLPVGTRQDPTYDGSLSFAGGFDYPYPGLLSQLFFTGTGSCTDEFDTSCQPFGPSYLSPSVCDVNPTDLQQTFKKFDGSTDHNIGHFVVKFCPPVVEYVRETVVDGDLGGFPVTTFPPGP